MKGSILLVIFVCFASIALAEEEGEGFLKAFPKADISALFGLDPSELESKRDYKESNYTSTLAACPTIALPADTNNVNNLRPGNIKVLLAMGDSITAGMGAKDTNVLSLKEYRGLAYCIGADTGIVTMPNLLKPYSPPGYPIGVSSGVGDRSSAGNGLNGAVSGAINKDMLGQAQWLVTKLKANTNINLALDWKLLTIWIGSNNLCDVCSDAVNNDANNFENTLTETLEYLYANVPRLFINLMSNLDITQLYDIKTGTCSLLHTIACGCVGSSSATERNKVYVANIEYQKRAPIIAKKFNGRSQEFAVVVQPFLTNSKTTDRSHLSAADCFHPSAISHAAASVGLWNNMITPAGQKRLEWNFVEQPLCATADTLLYTN